MNNTTQTPPPLEVGDKLYGYNSMGRLEQAFVERITPKTAIIKKLFGTTTVKRQPRFDSFAKSYGVKDNRNFFYLPTPGLDKKYIRMSEYHKMTRLMRNAQDLTLEQMKQVNAILEAVEEGKS